MVVDANSAKDSAAAHGHARALGNLNHKQHPFLHCALLLLQEAAGRLHRRGTHGLLTAEKYTTNRIDLYCITSHVYIYNM